jgi:hypothetical protein
LKWQLFALMVEGVLFQMVLIYSGTDTQGGYLGATPYPGEAFKAD